MNNENRTPDYDFSGLSRSFQALLGNPEQMFQIFDIFPMPIEIFDPDGTSVYINRAMMDVSGISDAGVIVEKYNLLKDPVCNEIFGSELLQRGFSGESLPLVNKKKKPKVASLQYFALFMKLDNIYLHYVPT